MTTLSYAPDFKQKGGEEKMAKDPVCGMKVDEKKARFNTEYEGKTYYFCAEMCKKKFEKDPKKFVK